MNNVGHIAGSLPSTLRKLTVSEDKQHSAKCLAERAREKPIRLAGKGFARLNNGDVTEVFWDDNFLGVQGWIFKKGYRSGRFYVKVGERVFAT